MRKSCCWLVFSSELISRQVKRKSFRQERRLGQARHRPAWQGPRRRWEFLRTEHQLRSLPHRRDRWQSEMRWPITTSAKTSLLELSGFVCAYHHMVLGSNPKYTIIASSSVSTILRSWVRIPSKRYMLIPFKKSNLLLYLAFCKTFFSGSQYRRTVTVFAPKTQFREATPSSKPQQIEKFLCQNVARSNRAKDGNTEKTYWLCRLWDWPQRWT